MFQFKVFKCLSTQLHDLTLKVRCARCLVWRPLWHGWISKDLLCSRS